MGFFNQNSEFWKLVMRVPEKYRNCRYANISQLFQGFISADMWEISKVFKRIGTGGTLQIAQVQQN
jgi:hypothetical protein